MWSSVITHAVLIGLALMTWLPACTSTPSDTTSDSPELACEKPTGIERALPPDFIGYETPEEAAEAWSQTVDLPEGTWHEHNTRFMVLVQDGHNVARASISTIEEPAATTSDGTRFMSPNIDFCDSR